MNGESRTMVDSKIAVPGFELTPFEAQQETRDVYRRGDGPAVIVMAEIPGITPLVAAYASRVAAAGFTVFLPQLFGTPMRRESHLYAAGVIAKLCIGREFNVLASRRSSPVVEWLRALARFAHAQCGGKGVGAVGMCITGNFGLAMMLDAPVIAPVLSQPSLPFSLTKNLSGSLHVSRQEIAAAHEKIDRQGARILGLRFKGDPMCRAARFAALQAEFGRHFEAIELEDAGANPLGSPPPHSVLTRHLIDESGQPTRAALERTIEFLREQLN
jgi:dienelactone hydrolase